MDAVRRIVVATDFSSGSNIAVERALQLARSHRATLDVLHAFDASALHSLGAVVDPHRLLGGTPADVRLRERLRALAESLAARSGLEVTPRFGVGDTAQALDAYVRAAQPALVVLARRADPMQRGVGSTLMRVLRTVSCPTLVVDGIVTAGEYERVLSAVDLRELSRKAAATALRLFPSAQHRLLWVVDPVWDREVWRGTFAPPADLAGSLREQAAAALEALAAELAQGAAAHPACEVAEGPPAPTLVHRAGEWPADCVAVGHHGQGPMAERWLGSTALDLIHHVVCDVLVVP